MGPARCSAAKAAAWAAERGVPRWGCDLAETFWEVCWVLGVRADVAYAQAIKETGGFRFGGVIDASFHNTCGLKTRDGGANDDPDAHARFPDWRTGIRAHAEHLHLYARGPVDPHVDPRHFPAIAGHATTVEALSGRWAPSETYHESIVAYVEEMTAMGTFLTWLPDVLRKAGVDVYVMPGAEIRSTRAAGLPSIRGIVWHHTATGPNWADGHVAALLRDGRRDLAGPLAQVGIERDGTWVIVALGRANHNGYGVWGNESLGLEFYNSGTGEPWPKAQVDSGIRGIAAICRHLGYDANRVQGHKETDPNRKIDPANLDMGEMRRRIAAAISTPQPSVQEDDDMLPIIIAIYEEHENVAGSWLNDPDGVDFWSKHGPAVGAGQLITDMLATIWIAATKK